MRGRTVLIAFVAVVLVSGCGANGRTVTVEIGEGARALRIEAEVAANGADRARGLMSRRELAPDAGMLFLFPVKVQAGFWMKNTLIPLDVAFIGDDRIIEIRSMVPCTRDPCPLTRPEAGYDSALEVNAGSFARSGVAVGDAVRVIGPLPKVS